MNAEISPEERDRRIAEEQEYAAARALRWIEICETDRRERDDARQE